ncbi:MAG TPA: AraC family transcriptional regulator [Acetobacteraceae bacterium]|jgi:AraC family transcriptional regulator|nr:AraC family transcriptional regulator [Acetobacteraceae bacterium]
MNWLPGDALLNTRVTAGALWPASPAESGRFASDPARPSVRMSPGQIIRRHTAEWSGTSAEVVHVTQRDKLTVQFKGSVHLLIAYMHGVRRDGETVIDGVHRSTLKDLGRKFTFVPADHEYRESYHAHVLPEIAFFYIDPASMAVEQQSGRAAAPLLPKLHFTDPILWETVSKLSAVIERSHSEERPYLAAIGAVLHHELRRVSTGVPAIDAPARGGLAPWQRRVALDYIEANVDQNIPMSKLSALARLSPHHFCRAFRQSVGMPPGRYHGHRRIERAKTLLGSSTLSVTEIGLSLGYSETSSFTAAFHRTTGVTPTVYRRRLS